jgi:hypothetical protein
VRKQVEDAKGAEALAVERASMVAEIAESLHKQIDAENKSSSTLQQ